MNTFVEIPATINSLSKRRPVFGVGINDADYMIYVVVDGKKIICPYYKVWKSMLGRCYNKKFHAVQPTYADCSVCDDWKIFTNFKHWMKNQDWYGKELDKDILKEGNKVYSSNLCVFISGSTNKLLNDRSRLRGKYPQGVSLDKRRGKFDAQCNVGGKKNYLGMFSTVSEAEEAYIMFKANVISQEAEKQQDARVRSALACRSKLMLNKLLHSEQMQS